jgi:hypothetical protein
MRLAAAEDRSPFARETVLLVDMQHRDVWLEGRRIREVPPRVLHVLNALAIKPRAIATVAEINAAYIAATGRDAPDLKRVKAAIIGVLRKQATPLIKDVGNKLITNRPAEGLQLELGSDDVLVIAANGDLSRPIEQSAASHSIGVRVLGRTDPNAPVAAIDGYRPAAGKSVFLLGITWAGPAVVLPPPPWCLRLSLRRSTSLSVHAGQAVGLTNRVSTLGEQVAEYPLADGVLLEPNLQLRTAPLEGRYVRNLVRAVQAFLERQIGSGGRE